MLNPMRAARRLALVTIFQFLEGLTDRQAADAVRDRLAWKYALSLELCDVGFDHTVLSEFRARAGREARPNSVCWISFWIGVGREGGGSAHGRQRTDSPHILAKIRSSPPYLACCPNDGLRVECADREVAPDWIRTHVPVEWVERYGQRLEEERRPVEEPERTQYAHRVGADGWMLLEMLQTPCVPDWMKTLPAVTTLHTMWEHQFEAREQGGQWRKEPVLEADSTARLSL